MTPSGTPWLRSVGNAQSGSPERLAKSWISSRKSGWPGGGWAFGGEPRVARMVFRSSLLREWVLFLSTLCRPYGLWNHWENKRHDLFA